jgi:hypothetical protein
MSSLVNYLTPTSFHSFEYAQSKFIIIIIRNINFILFFKIERNRSYEMSSFSETAAFNLHKGKKNKF